MPGSSYPTQGAAPSGRPLCQASLATSVSWVPSLPTQGSNNLDPRPRGPGRQHDVTDLRNSRYPPRYSARSVPEPRDCSGLRQVWRKGNVAVAARPQWCAPRQCAEHSLGSRSGTSMQYR